MIARLKYLYERLTNVIQRGLQIMETPQRKCIKIKRSDGWTLSIEAINRTSTTCEIEMLINFGFC
jgi:hypothetical protein